ncbi:ROK family transcriptional regulator [Prolixibacteraceae bacterium Z1-6]|uniref:ROK family transcriptional regulator n=1 Tax=Draconibacterium aestuarii TaxID=2998507 RepID=A0A9X3FA12_9BACT|nr:ROK family transcriptional regulator [Prolixibacteraceae bacterium Z1-6]
MILIEDIHDIDLTGNELKNYRSKKRILDLLYRYDTLSATALSKRIGVSLPKAIALLKELSNLNLVESRGAGKSRGGRKPMLFGLKNDSIFVVACELGRFKGKIGIYDSHTQLVAPVSEFATSVDDEELVDKIYSNAQKIIRKNKIDDSRVLGIGLAMPGLVDELQGINYTIKNKAFQNVKERLQKKFHGLVYVNNDARMQAYGEFIFGEAIGHNNAMIINWNWGLGLGMILDGKLYNGATGFAGELSHTKFVDDGELCICGKRGCLETVTSAYVLIAKAKEAIKQGKISQLTEKFKNREEDLGIEDIIQAAKLGDEFSIALINEVGLALGKALSKTIQLLNPDIIVLGGVVSEANQYVLTPIQQAINQHCLEQISGNTKIVISEDWKQSGLQGVTAMLFQKLFSDMYK